MILATFCLWDEWRILDKKVKKLNRKNKFFMRIAKVIVLSVLLVSFFIFSGCNKNPGSVEPVRGPCDGLIYRYYFDQESQSCKEFLWGGCGGVVPFETMHECVVTCKERDDCPPDCPMWAPPSPDFCVNGTIVSGGYDRCGCTLPPRCVE